MKLSVWSRPGGEPEAVEDETGVLYVRAGEHFVTAARLAVEAVRGTGAEQVVFDLLYSIGPEMNGVVLDEFLAAVGLTEQERLRQFGVI